MIRSIAIAILTAGLLGLAGFVLLSWRPVIAAIERPAPESFSTELVTRENLSPRLDIVRLATRVPGDSLSLADME